DPDAELFDILGHLTSNDAVLINDDEGHLVGIVTSYDAVEYLRWRAGDMMCVEDIEGLLQDCIKAAYSRSQGDIDTAALAEAIKRKTAGKKDRTRKPAEQILEYYLTKAGNGSTELNKDLFEEAITQLDNRPPKELEKLTLQEYIELLLD